MANPDPALLAANLAAAGLERGSAPLAEVRDTPAGAATCQIDVGGDRRWLASAYDPIAEARVFAAQAEGDVLLVGIGLGHALPFLLERGRVVAYEPDPSLLRTALALHDFTEPLRTGRLQIVEDLAGAHRLRPLPERVLRWPPTADEYLDPSRQLRFETWAGAGHQRLLMVHNKLFVDDLVPLFEERGWAVRVVAPAGLSVARLAELVEETSARCLFSINFSPPLAYLAKEHDLRYVSWTVDPLPRSRLQVMPGTDLDRCRAFAHRHAIVDTLTRLGIEASHLPLAASPRRLPDPDASALARYRCPVSFVGSSLVVDEEGLVARVRQWGGDEALVAKVSALVTEVFLAHRDDRTFVGEIPIPTWLERALPEADPEELSDRLDGALSHRLRMDRVGLLNGQGMHVYGDEGWAPLGDSYRGRAEHGLELSCVYHASAANLDVPRVYQRDILTMRVFDVLACGAPLLVEHHAAVEELFEPGRHLLTYRDRSELRARVDRLAASRREGRALGAAGRERVLADHCLHHRVDVLDRALR